MKNPFKKLIKKNASRAITIPRKKSSPYFSVVSPDEFRSAFNAAAHGRPEKLYGIMDFFLKVDGHLAGVLQSRIAAVLNSGGNIVTDDKKKKAIIRKMFENFGLHDMMKELLEAPYFGLRAIDIIWGDMQIDKKNYFAPIEWNIVPHQYIESKKINHNDTHTTLHIFDRPVQDYQTGKLLISIHGHISRYDDIDFTTLGKGLGALRYSIYKFYDVEDWAAFNEVYAMPLRLGKYSQNAGKEEIATLTSAVKEMGTDASAIISEETDITFPEVNRANSTDSYERFERACDQSISTALLSESRTTNDGKNGTYGSMKTANGIRVDVAAGDAKKATKLINTQLMTPFLRHNFSGNTEASISFPVKPHISPEQLAAIYSNIYNMGLDMSKKDLYEKFDLAMPEDEEDTLSGGTGLLGL
jgi:phage gp29-like protein